MDVEPITSVESLLVKIVQFAWPVVLPYLGYLARKFEKSDKKIEELQAQIDDGIEKCSICKSHLAGMDERIKHTLTIEQLNAELRDIYNLIRDMTENQGYMKSKLESTEATINRIDHFLRQRNG